MTEPANERRPSVGALVAGGVLMGIGGLVGLVGAVLVGSTVASAIRRRMREMEVPPGELARQKWTRAKAAATAGANAYKDGSAESRSAPSAG